MATAVKQEIHQDLRSMPSTYANRLVCGVKPKVAKRYGDWDQDQIPRVSTLDEVHRCRHRPLITINPERRLRREFALMF